jgi:amphiphysin
LNPLIELVGMQKIISERIKKRGHKLLDFDRHKATFNKMQEQKDPDPSHEKKMIKVYLFNLG